MRGHFPLSGSFQNSCRSYRCVLKDKWFKNQLSPRQSIFWRADGGALKMGDLRNWRNRTQQTSTLLWLMQPKKAKSGATVWYIREIKVDHERSASYTRVHLSDPHVTHNFQSFKIIYNVQLNGDYTHLDQVPSLMLQEAQCGPLGDAISTATPQSLICCLLKRRWRAAGESMFGLSDACVYVKNAVQRV